MLEKCFRSWDESIRGLNTLWRRDWSFPPRPGRDRSKRSSIHHPPGLLARYSLFGGFLSLVSSVSLAQDPATVGQFSSVTSWPYVACPRSCPPHWQSDMVAPVRPTATTRTFGIPRQTRIVQLCKREQTFSAQAMPFYPTDSSS